MHLSSAWNNPFAVLSANLIEVHFILIPQLVFTDVMNHRIFTPSCERPVSKFKIQVFLFHPVINGVGLGSRV